jgi:hypothetical protein
MYYNVTMTRPCNRCCSEKGNDYYIFWVCACSLKADSHIACRAHAVPLPCRAAKGLECVFPIWFTHCGRVWFIKMWSVNQTRPHYVNQMGKTHSKPLAARHGRGTAWERHAMCESALDGAATGTVFRISCIHTRYICELITSQQKLDWVDL